MFIMRKITFLLSLMVVVCLNAQDKVECDTVTNVKNAGNVIITETGGGVKVLIKGAGDDKDYVYSYKQSASPDSKISISQDWNLHLPFTKSSVSGNKKKRSKWSVVSGGFYFGYNNTVDETIGEKTTSSMEIAWDRILGMQYKPFANGPAFSLGFGVGWKNIGFKDTYKCFSGDRNQIYIGQFDEERIPKSSRLKVFSLRVPFMASHKLFPDLRLSAGTIMNVNTHASVKNCYLREDDVKVEESFSGVPVRKVSWDVMGALSWDCIGVYVKYCPQTMFKSGKGPQFKTFSIGFGLFL